MHRPVKHTIALAVLMLSLAAPASADRIADRNKDICSRFVHSRSDQDTSATFETCLDVLDMMFAEENRFGSRFIWRMNESLIVDDKTPIYTLYAYSKWRRPNCSGGDLNCAVTLQIECLANHYKLSFVAPCPMCVTRGLLVGPVKVNVTADNLGFELRGYSDEFGQITAALNAEQMQGLSRSRRYIMATVQGRPPIYTEARGTAAAFDLLAAACR